MSIAPRCLSIDLEVGIKDQRIYQFAAIRGDTGESFVYSGKKSSDDLNKALAQLDEFTDAVAFLLGHNLIAFDSLHLQAAKPDLRLLKLPMVDTLRLNPLAFPRNPYHHLVKHYKTGQLQRGSINHPELDARLTLQVFADQLKALEEAQASAPDLILIWHWLITDNQVASGLNSFFMKIRRQLRPTDQQALAAIRQILVEKACATYTQELLNELESQQKSQHESTHTSQQTNYHDSTQHASKHGWALAYALAWLSVAGGNSVMPPWVRYQFPEAGGLIRLLRDRACNDASCHWCQEHHNPRKELKRWFGFDAFRAEPADASGRPLQEVIVEAALQGTHVLGVLPTGTGKSLCYQIPALSRYDKTGALTVVISPLVALMADQVAGLEARGITSCVAINGLLSMPERATALDRIRLGDISILIIAPEQLRSKALRNVLEQREIGAWVLDEAHCISKWGHDFRPDYRYVGRFIKEKAGSGQIAPVLCLTATAKPDVIEDMLGHFKDKVGIELTLFNGGAKRTNLDFFVTQTNQVSKFADIDYLLQQYLTSGGAIVYCATKKQTEEVADFLRAKGRAAGYFHAGLSAQQKKTTQQEFIQGTLSVIAATNAFGMGIDKPDVRLVIHADIPGSLENYLQEAGRAGRDCEAARCILLYTEEDVERQFGMSARSRLSQQDIAAILKSIRRLDRKKNSDGEVIATAGEILTEETDAVFERDSATDDTRVRTAIAWLEEAELLHRDENEVQIFPSSLRVQSVAEAEVKLAARRLFADYQRALLALVRALFASDPDEGISTDELMHASGLSAEKVRAALYDLESFGIASNDTALTAYVDVAVANASKKKFEQACALEEALLTAMRAHAPDMQKGDAWPLQLRFAAQTLKDQSAQNSETNLALDVTPEKLTRILRSLANDGQSEDGVGSLSLRKLDAENLQISLQREWHTILEIARRRRSAAANVLEHLLSCLPPGARGNDQLTQTTLGKMLAALNSDLMLVNQIKSPNKLLDRALMWLHEQGVIRLNKGLAVFRPAMKIRLNVERRSGFIKNDFKPLQLHYDEKTVQIHVMAEYVKRGLQQMADALGLAMDYFMLERDEFIARWLPAREKELLLQTTPASWRSIVENLNNRVQQKIVSDDRELNNVLVLAGPGSGKTRVLVHRIAYLLRVKRENPHGIIALAYNRHAAFEIRRRLADLIGDDAKGVVVLTCHALAMRLAGISFAKRKLVDQTALNQVIPQALALLNGTGLPPQEADEQRDRLLSGFRWILVDEYQDIGADEYALIEALAGRKKMDEDGRLSLFAVGDDDQNIYAFNGTSVDFIRRFETDYNAKPDFLIENYRSTHHIIDAANHVIALADQRMKVDHPIRTDSRRSKAAAGGEWEARDPIGQGRVQVLPAGANSMTQAISVMIELQRLATLSPDWSWAKVAVIARNWEALEPVRTYCLQHAIPVQVANEDTAQFWRLRETQNLVHFLLKLETPLITSEVIAEWIKQQVSNIWLDLLHQANAEYALETQAEELPVAHFIDWLAEWGREARRKQSGLLLLTAHRAKGLEFDHVAVLDGDWERVGTKEDKDAPRRLFYVAMTRARYTLLLAKMQRQNLHASFFAEFDAPCFLHRSTSIIPTPTAAMRQRYVTLTMKDINLDFAGQRANDDPIHHHISCLTTGDPLLLKYTNNGWELYTNKGDRIGRLSKAFAPPSDKVCICARVSAIILRLKEDVTEPNYLSKVRSEQWEVVLPEFIFE